MPQVLESCVRKVQAGISSGKYPKGSSAWAICVSQLKKAGTIKKNPKGSVHQWSLAAKKAETKAKRIRGNR